MFTIVAAAVALAALVCLRQSAPALDGSRLAERSRRSRHRDDRNLDEIGGAEPRQDVPGVPRPCLVVRSRVSEPCQVARSPWTARSRRLAQDTGANMDLVSIIAILLIIAVLSCLNLIRTDASQRQRPRTSPRTRGQRLSRLRPAGQRSPTRHGLPVEPRGAVVEADADGSRGWPYCRPRLVRLDRGDPTRPVRHPELEPQADDLVADVVIYRAPARSHT